MKNNLDSFNIMNVVSDKLCIGCCTCINICPTECISIIKDENGFFPRVNLAKCKNCGVCLRVCPSFSIDFNSLNLEIFGRVPKNPLIGNYIGAYIGYSSDEKIRFNASSGGLISSLLIFLLERKVIDGAIVTRMKRDNPLEPDPFIAQSKSEVISAMGSKYCPVPLNMALREILNTNGKFAIVGLPCHIAGIRKLENFIPELKKKITLCLGLFCSHTCNFRATLYLLYLFGIKSNQVTKLYYRGYGWPGYATIILNSDDRKFIPYKWYSKYHELFFFTPLRCLLCPDPLSQLADISFGDAWISEIMSSDIKGTSVCISRTLKGDGLLKKAALEKKIILQKMTSKQFKEIIPSMFRLRRIKAVKRITSKKKPMFYMDLPDPSILDHIIVLVSLFNNLLANHGKLWKFILPISSIEQQLQKVLKLSKVL